MQPVTTAQPVNTAITAETPHRPATVTLSPATMATIHRHMAQHPHCDETTTAAIIRKVIPAISDMELLAVLRRISDDSTGLGVLEPLLALPGVTDIVVTAPDRVYIDRGNGLEHTQVTFHDDGQVRQLATRLMLSCGRRLDDAQPYADGRLNRPDGTAIRIHGLLSPPSEQHTQISVRILRQANKNLDHLVGTGTMPAHIAELCRAVVKARRAMLIVGGTGTGKTTLLSALLQEVAPTERMILIEDTPELCPHHPHVVTLVTRANNAEGAGAITMATLLQQALRMRPDRIIVGEIRGAEVVDLLAALNTGHAGGAGTVHANSLQEVPARMEALAALGGLDRQALHSQLAAAIDVVFCLVRTSKGRKLAAIGQVHPGPPVTITPLWDWQTGPAAGFSTFCRSLTQQAAPCDGETHTTTLRSKQCGD
nr:TadA family conjugal transfer-associated ATPase [Corynebacterium choanae]